MNTQPKAILWITLLTALPPIRASMIGNRSTIEIFGGVPSNAWFGTWLTDSILGILGAYDYVHGLLTQWLSPIVGSLTAGVYTFMGCWVCLQLLVVFALFRQPVIPHYSITS